MFSRVLSDHRLRPAAMLVLLCIAFSVISGEADFFDKRALMSVFQHFATLGLIALALGLTMLMREFDLSVGGMMALGGCVAVLTGNQFAMAGLLMAVLIGVVGGLIQGVLIVRSGLGSVAISLGGLLTFIGLSYVITGNQTVALDSVEMAIAINAPLGGIISIRALLVAAFFVLAGLVMSYSRTGRNIIASGSNRQASVVAGIEPDRLLVGVFGLSGGLSALAGALLAIGLSSAVPGGGASDILVPAVAAAILGGVSLSGGTGHPLGIAAGVLILCILRTGLTTLQVEPYVHDLVTGAILMIVAITDGPHLRMRGFQIFSPLRQRRAVYSEGDSQ